MTELLNNDDLVSVFSQAEKPPGQFRIGAENEKFGVHKLTGAPLFYQGDFSVGRVIEHLLETDVGAYEITLFNAEPRGNYNRIMLSPVLSGDKTYADIVTHDDAWYAANGITCRFGERVGAIDRQAKTVTAENGDVLAYDKLLFGTGSNPFMIPLPGAIVDALTQPMKLVVSSVTESVL